MSESDIYDALTTLFVGIPAKAAVPVLCEALIHAINCAENDCRAEMCDIAIATIKEHVDLCKGYERGYAA